MTHDHGGGLDDLHAELDTAPVFESAREGDTAALSTTLDSDPTQRSARDKYGFTALHWACDRGHEHAAALLLERGADVNAVEKRLFKRTPLLLAALSGNAALVQLLLRHGANVAAADYKGWCAVHCAVHAGCVEAMHALVAAGANVDALTKRNESVLHLAARAGHAALVAELVSCEENASGGATAVIPHSAVAAASGPLHQLLPMRICLSREVIDMQDADGATAVDVAHAGGHAAVVAAILSSTSQR